MHNIMILCSCPCLTLIIATLASTTTINTLRVVVCILLLSSCYAFGTARGIDISNAAALEINATTRKRQSKKQRISG